MWHNGQTNSTGQEKYNFNPPLPPNQQQQQQQQQQINQSISAPLESREMMDMLIKQLNMVKQINQTNQINVSNNQQPFGATTGNSTNTSGFGDLTQFLLQQQQYGNIPRQPTSTGFNFGYATTPPPPTSQSNSSTGFNFEDNIPSQQTQTNSFSLFGSSQPQTSNSFGNFSGTTQTTGFNFGSNLVQNNDPFGIIPTEPTSPGFNFGYGTTLPPPNSQSNSSAGFNFGDNIPSQQTSGFSIENTGFDFGPLPSQSTSQSSSNGFNFGSNQDPSTQSGYGSYQVLQSNDPFGIPTQPTSSGFNYGPPPVTTLPPPTTSTGFNFGSTSQSNQESFLEFIANVSPEEIDFTPKSIGQPESISSLTEVVDSNDDIKASVPTQPKKNFLNSIDGMDILSIVLSIALVFFAIFVFYY